MLEIYGNYFQCFFVVTDTCVQTYDQLSIIYNRNNYKPFNGNIFMMLYSPEDIMLLPRYLHFVFMTLQWNNAMQHFLYVQSQHKSKIMFKISL